MAFGNNISNEILGTEISFEKFHSKKEIWYRATVLRPTRNPKAIAREVAALQAKYGEKVRDFKTRDAEYFEMQFPW